MCQKCTTHVYNCECRRTTSVGLPVVLSHTQNTTQVVDSMMGYVIISPLSIIFIQIHITIQT